MPDNQWIISVCRDLANFANENGLAEFERAASMAVLTAERELGLVPSYDTEMTLQSTKNTRGIVMRNRDANLQDASFDTELASETTNVIHLGTR